MYKLLRNIHLAAGLFASVLLVAYGLTALLMAFPFYRPEPRVSESSVGSVPEDLASSPRALARWLMDEHGMRGDLIEAAATSSGLRLTIARPGTAHDVEYTSATRVAYVTTRVDNAVGMLIALHQVRGVSHEDGGTRAWSWLLLSGSVALLLLSVTGVVLWFKRHDERRIGAIVLAIGLAWGLTLLALVRSA